MRWRRGVGSQAAACTLAGPPRTTRAECNDTPRCFPRARRPRSASCICWGKARAKRGTAPRIDSGPWGGPSRDSGRAAGTLRAGGRTRQDVLLLGAAPCCGLPQAKQLVGWGFQRKRGGGQGRRLPAGPRQARWGAAGRPHPRLPGAVAGRGPNLCEGPINLLVERKGRIGLMRWLLAATRGLYLGARCGRCAGPAGAAVAAPLRAVTADIWIPG